MPTEDRSHRDSNTVNRKLREEQSSAKGASRRHGTSNRERLRAALKCAARRRLSRPSVTFYTSFPKRGEVCPPPTIVLASHSYLLSQTWRWNKSASVPSVAKPCEGRTATHYTLMFDSVTSAPLCLRCYIKVVCVIAFFALAAKLLRRRPFLLRSGEQSTWQHAIVE